MVTAAENRDRWRVTNPDKYKALVDKESARLKDRYHSDTEFRLAHNKAGRDRYHSNKIQKAEYYLWAAAKKRAKEKNIPFSILIEDVIIPDLCPVFRVRLSKQDGKAGPYSPSLDRIVPTLGYVKGNIQVISKKANAMKLDALPDELRQFAYWILRKEGETYDGSSI